LASYVNTSIRDPHSHDMIDRRRFLATLGALSLGACAGTAPPRRNPGESALNLDTRVQGRALRRDMLGLSFESAQLADTCYFTPANTTLVRLLRNLGTGTLRLGGASSDTGLWQPTQHPVAPPYRFAIRAVDIARLRDFLDAADWRLIYGLDLAHGDADRAGDEAAHVANLLGDRLDAFQIGNEPDLYEHNGLRPAGYGANAFIAEWKRYAATIRARAGDVPLAGPDIAYKQDWLEAFARAAASEVKFLSDHYYPIGPAQNPDVDIPELWQSQLTRYPHLREAVQKAAAAGKPLRITEGNSCWEGGKAGVSDTMASALWAISLLSGFWRDGGDGFCFHGGPAAVYSPIAGGAAAAPCQPRPLYYGLLLLARMLPGILVDARFEIATPMLQAFATRDADGHVNVAIVNLRQAGAIDVRVRAERPLARGNVLHLSAPTLFNRDGVSFGGSEIADDGQWIPRTQTAVIDKGDAFVTVASASAVQMQFVLQ
jgi:hypothetical protein